MSANENSALLSALVKPPARTSASDSLRAVISGASKSRGLRGRLLGVIGGMGLVGCVGYFAVIAGWSGSSHANRPLVAQVKRSSLRITVTERGSLESCKTVDGICEVGGQNKVVFLVAEGSRV